MKILHGLMLLCPSAALLPAVRPLAPPRAPSLARALTPARAAVARARALAPPRLGASTYLDTIEPAPAFAAGELAKYAVALGGQFGLMAAGFVAIDALAARALAAPLPAPAVGVLFAFLSLRSRVFSLMDNSRPNREAQGGGAPDGRAGGYSGGRPASRSAARSWRSPVACRGTPRCRELALEWHC